MSDRNNLSVQGDDHESPSTRNNTVIKRNKRKSNDTQRLISASINKIAEAINPSRNQNINLSSPPELTQKDAGVLIICSLLNYSNAIKKMLMVSYELN